MSTAHCWKHPHRTSPDGSCGDRQAGPLTLSSATGTLLGRLCLPRFPSSKLSLSKNVVFSDNIPDVPSGDEGKEITANTSFHLPGFELPTSRKVK